MRLTEQQIKEELKEIDKLVKEAKSRTKKLESILSSKPYPYLYELLDVVFEVVENKDYENIAYKYTDNGNHIALRFEEIFKDKDTKQHFVKRLMELNSMDMAISPTVLSFKNKSKRCYVMTIDTYEKLKMCASEEME